MTRSCCRVIVVLELVMLECAGHCGPVWTTSTPFSVDSDSSWETGLMAFYSEAMGSARGGRPHSIDQTN